MRAKYATYKTRATTAAGRKGALRHKNVDTADRLLGAFRSGAHTDTSAKADYERFFGYAGKPITFMKRELGATFAPKINELIRSVENNPITIAQSCNSYGKTHAAAHIAISFLVTHPDSQVFTTAAPPESNLKHLLWGEIGLLTKKYGDRLEFPSYDTVSLPGMKIERHPKCGIYGLTIPTVGTVQEREAKFGGKHAPYQLFIVDEADAVPDEIFRAIESCLSGGIMARLLCMFNPRRESGAVYNFISNKLANVIKLDAFTHPNVIQGIDVYPGAVTRDTTVRRIWLWTEALGEHDTSDENCFIVPKWLENYVAKRTDGGWYPALPGGWRRIISPEFSYMVLAEYPTISEGQLISTVWINRAVERGKQFRERYSTYPNFYIQPCMGFDVAETTDQNCVTFRYDYYVAPQILWNGIDVPTSSDKAADFYHKYNAQWCNVDANGLGAAAPKLMKRRSCMAYGIKAQQGTTEDAGEDYGEFERMRDQGWWALREWLKTNPRAMLPNDPKLIEELKVATYHRDDKSGKIKVSSNDTMKEKLPYRRSPDRATSLMLTFCPQPEEEAPGDFYSSNYAFSPEDERPSTMLGLDMEPELVPV